MRFICIFFIFSYCNQSFCGNFFIGLSGNLSLDNYNFIDINNIPQNENQDNRAQNTQNAQDNKKIIIDSIEDLIKEINEAKAISETKTNNKEERAEYKIKEGIVLELKNIVLNNQNNEILDKHFLYSKEQIKNKLQNEINLLSKWNLSSWQDIGLDAIHSIPFSQMIQGYVMNQMYNTLFTGYNYLYNTASVQNQNIARIHDDVYENIQYQNNELNNYGNVMSNNVNILQFRIESNEKNLHNLENSHKQQLTNVVKVLEGQNKALIQTSKISQDTNQHIEKLINDIILSNNSPTVMEKFTRSITPTMNDIAKTQTENRQSMTETAMASHHITNIINTQLNESFDSIEILQDDPLSLKKPRLSSLKSIPELENPIESNPPIIQNKAVSDFIFSSILNFFPKKYFFYTLYPIQNIYNNYTNQEHQNKYEDIFRNTLNDFLQTYHQKSYTLKEISNKENSKKDFEFKEISNKENSKKDFEFKRQSSSNLLSFSLFAGYTSFINNFGFITEIGIDIFGNKINNNNENKIEFKNNVGFYITEKIGYKFTNKTLTYVNLGFSVNNTEIKYNDIVDEKQNITNFILGGGSEFKSSNEKLGIFIEVNNAIAFSLIETKIGKAKSQSYQMKVGVRYYHVLNQKKYPKSPKLIKKRLQ